MRIAALCVLVVVLPALPAAAQQNFVLKAACIGGAANATTEVAATADGTISRRHYRGSGGGTGWRVLGRDQAQVRNWLRTVDATQMKRVRVPTTEDRNPCNERSSLPCHIVRRKGNVDYYACRAKTVQAAMLGFNK
jgi:hypothetical protein